MQFVAGNTASFKFMANDPRLNNEQNFFLLNCNNVGFCESRLKLTHRLK